MTTFIAHTPEKKQLQEISKFFDEIDPQLNAEDTFRNLLKEKQFEQVMQFICDHQQLLWDKLEGNDVDNFYYIVTTLLIKLSTEIIQRILPQIINVISGDIEVSVQNRLSLLKSLFNLHIHAGQNSDWWKVYIYKAILSYAIASNQTELLVEDAKTVSEKVQAWETTTEDVLILYKSAITILKNNDPQTTWKYIHSYLNNSEDATDTEFIAEILDYGIKHPNIFYFERISNNAIVKDVLSSDNLNDINGLVSANYLQYKESGNNDDVVSSKVRKLNFAKVAIEKPVITYAEVSEFLDLSPDDVEEFVVECILDGHVKATLDQEHEQINIINVSQNLKYNSKEDWNVLLEKLVQWKAGVTTILEKIQDQHSVVDDE
eukprot:TRINITY_DN11640_c0_g1_i1.p1 TRINITY_DN11640_c0_g1~~TRINITY_DN11640_c0_g1_i1.p1  ORF type:complete len:375 (-),score=83.74 TRINITY_DN11640_c0_g1_i1:28-1152(-)